jgi:hypothetical protein
MDTYKEIFEKTGESGALIAPAADEEAIQKCNADLKGNGFPELPEGYIAFLERANGYFWMDFEFFATHENTLTEMFDDELYEDVIPGAFETNIKFREEWDIPKHLLILGHSSNEYYYIYDSTKKKYQDCHSQPLTSLAPVKEYDDFESLFKDTVGSYSELEDTFYIEDFFEKEEEAGEGKKSTDW